MFCDLISMKNSFAMDKTKEGLLQFFRTCDSTHSRYSTKLAQNVGMRITYWELVYIPWNVSVCNPSRIHRKLAGDFDGSRRWPLSRRGCIFAQLYPQRRSKLINLLLKLASVSTLCQKNRSDFPHLAKQSRSPFSQSIWFLSLLSTSFFQCRLTCNV